MDLLKIRGEIDSLDEQIQLLISQRATLAQAVAKEKIASNPDKKADFYRSEREAQVLRTIISRNKGPLADDTIRHLFREIMSACLALEKPINVAFLGPIGTYTQSAALKHFGTFAHSSPLSSIADVFRAVERGESQYGVVPVENSTEGVISHTLDQFLGSDLKICGEVELPIHHNIMSKSKDLKEIKRVYAHQQSLMQCRCWLEINLPQVMQVPVSSNAEAARMCKTTEGSAAIAGAMAADVYELNVLVENIEDELKNTTRFLVIGKNTPGPSGSDKTSIVLKADNQPGTLHRMLEPFSSLGISLTKIESRPSRRVNWEYVFFVDIAGHKEDELVKQALALLEENNQIVSVLGSYPKSI